ncbi:universal stress protein [Paraburkholderia phenazinium]|uniref:Nucleotide-binding universal stress protein, UspA family n=1 Tax=Paraburkholderia phenazinium TaxID=60549 RepID=A0A1G8BD90_9BURK|nr:universal stress protein [Paraburkholderia phenazinium]SDH31186.1 Nucleotide-binding universal stress protein, UspA family [Paraburkholderia phenazinium]
MYKRILAAIDGSRGARLALDEAVKIAQASDGTITAVCVGENPAQLVDVGTLFVEAPSPVSTAANEAATAALEEAQDLFERRKVRGVTRTLDSYGEDVATVLSRTADELKADLVVMGTSGRHGVRRVLLGSVAESFLRLSRVPVLLVRYDPDVDPIPSSL